MQFEGRVKEVMPVQSGVSQRTGEPWSSQEFVFGFYETSDAIYEKEIVLRLRNDKIKQLDLQVDDKIRAKFSLGTSIYEGRKYNQIFTGDIEILQRAPRQRTAPQQPATSPQPQATTPTTEQPAGDDDDDLPF